MSGAALPTIAPRSAVTTSVEKKNIMTVSDGLKRVTGRKESDENCKVRRFNNTTMQTGQSVPIYRDTASSVYSPRSHRALSYKAQSRLPDVEITLHPAASVPTPQCHITGCQSDWSVYISGGVLVVELVTAGECFCNSIGWPGMGRCGAASRTRHELHFWYRADGMRDIGLSCGRLAPRFML
jgi:hypothetical protein